VAGGRQQGRRHGRGGQGEQDRAGRKTARRLKVRIPSRDVADDLQSRGQLWEGPARPITSRHLDTVPRPSGISAEQPILKPECRGNNRRACRRPCMFNGHGRRQVHGCKARDRNIRSAVDAVSPLYFAPHKSGPLARRLAINWRFAAVWGYLLQTLQTRIRLSSFKYCAATHTPI
jgi:hypothetical protein